MSTPGPRTPHVLREYALLADGERGALVGPRGDFAWLCFPRWHDDAVLCSLIGGRSTYAISPATPFTWGGYYEPGTLIWRSRWITREGIVECREALALPTDQSGATLLRRVEAVDCAARLEVLLQPGAGFDRHGMAALRRGDDGSWTAHLGDLSMRWEGGAAAAVIEDADSKALAQGLELAPGERHDFVLVLSAAGQAEPRGSADRLWEATEEAWRERVPDLETGIAARDARHAYAVMSGLTSASGAMVAAATTSLPERAEQGRSYDYRFAWIRDQAYAGQAVAAAGPHPLLEQAVGFITERLLADGPHLMPAYTVDGNPVPDERELPLPGYPGGVDILGNRVREQFQLDAFGEALLVFAAAADHDRLDADGWRAAEIAAEAISERWREADAGVWELAPKEWTHSRLVCAAGLRAIAARAPGTKFPAQWPALADELLAAASAGGLNPAGDWRRAPDDDRTDAALLLAGIRGAVPADDPRLAATLRRVTDELCEDGYCYRFRQDARPLGDAEGAFLLCGFWMSLALAARGDRGGALSWFERSRAACGPPGLFAEEFDVRQRQLRGNLPQAFVHALMLECAATLAEA